MRKPLKKKKCRECPIKFQPVNSLQVVCSPPCAIKKLETDRQKKAKRELKASKADTRKRKQALKTRSDWLRLAQETCNAYIRYRDRHKGCISCNTRKPDIQYCAGHYKSRGGFPELRFHPSNIHKQCNKNCNSALSGNKDGYIPALVQKVGQGIVDWLDGPHEPQNWTIEDIQDIKQHYKELLKYAKL